MKKKVVLATKNEGKIREMAEALSHLPLDIITLAPFGELPEPDENGTTFAENALIKAKFYSEKTGCACLADDSGLEVAALGGAPGVHSARFAGIHATDETNNNKLIYELKNAGVKESPAAYRCVLAFVDTDSTELIAEGSCAGTVKKNAKGDGGFGYDPYFYLNDGRTMAELTLEEKDAISHRGQALRRLASKLSVHLEAGGYHE